ncbi:hypothetical protein RQM59_01790 [Flavobacteriaceae bacterium S356]|uniref:WD40 repeat protein n=1 Tax=Asprobacillus argus TaxID=3076534 RepID=A0ABU3LBI3_9FLAO|nr:hypothetical protein [Flavobacteriaceae bacterium S356]
MNKTLFKFGLLTLSSLFSYISCSNISKEPARRVFEDNNISTKSVELSPTFSSDGREVYFTRSTGKWGMGGGKSSIYYSVNKNGKWSTPKLASFSGEYNDGAPHLCANGKTLYFTSTRPVIGVEKASKDIWKVERGINNVWGSPIRLAFPINSERSEYSPSTDKWGNLYFASNRSGGYGQGDIYFAKKEKDTFASSVNMGAVINADSGEWNVEINDNGDILIFESSGRDENLSPYGDLYISFRLNNQWSVPQNMEELNTTGSDLYAELTHGDTLLYYTSSDSLPSIDTDIYVIEFDHIHKKYHKRAIFSE